MLTLEAIKREWMHALDLSKLDLNPLQFANYKRIQRHNAVFIFDEVGSGKTISSGIMALEYLETNPEKDVLIITTNTLKRGDSLNPFGQFLGDWVEKLPFNQLNFTSRVKVLNNHYSNFVEEINCGLLIIDEAHLFLNEETDRYQYLTQNVTADKVIILTATPTTSGISDLERYVHIAQKITKDTSPILAHWMNKLGEANDTEENLICSQFSLENPITRYFKTTIEALSATDTLRNNPKRCESILWKYDYSQDRKQIIERILPPSHIRLKLRDLPDDTTNKDVTLAAHILKSASGVEENKFVIFTRYVDLQAKKLGELFESLGIPQYPEKNTDNFNYYVVTGENRGDLAKFKSKNLETVPTILILTYQISEQGVNLPGFNHIVNYHIPSSPSALEQRYGRIDRLGSKHKSIYNCFLISDTSLDGDTLNFHFAVHSYLHAVVTWIPSRNTLLTEEILNRYLKKSNWSELYIQQLKKNTTLKNLKNLCKFNQGEKQLYSEEISFLLEFVNNNGIILPENDHSEKAVNNLYDNLQKHISRIDSYLKNPRNDEKANDFLEFGDKLWNGTFYSQIQNSLSVFPTERCATIIAKNEQYKTFLEELQPLLSLSNTLESYAQRLNEQFEQAFLRNDFNTLFPKNYADVVQLTQDELQHIESLGGLEKLISRLPFFKMVHYYKEVLCNLATSEKGLCTDRHPFAYAMSSLEHRKDLMSEKFYNTYFANLEHPKNGTPFQQFFNITKHPHTNSNGEDVEILVADPWFKLAFQVTSKETIKFSNQKNIFEFIFKKNFGNRYTPMASIILNVLPYQSGELYRLKTDDWWSYGIQQVLFSVLINPK